MNDLPTDFLSLSLGCPLVPALLPLLWSQRRLRRHLARVLVLPLTNCLRVLRLLERMMRLLRLSHRRARLFPASPADFSAMIRQLYGRTVVDATRSYW